MRFLHGTIKAHAGDKISVEFSERTRVLVMRDREFNKYKNNMTFTYYGGEKDSPYEFVIPKSGTWVVVIEKGTYANPKNIQASIKKTTGAPAPVKRIAKTMKEADEMLAQESAEQEQDSSEEENDDNNEN